MKLKVLLIDYHMLSLVDQVKEKLNRNVIKMLVVIEYFQQLFSIYSIVVQLNWLQLILMYEHLMYN
jgi:hypothetical protein